MAYKKAKTRQKTAKKKTAVKKPAKKSAEKKAPAKQKAGNNKIQAMNPWMIATIALAVLLIASVATSGFGSCKGTGDFNDTIDQIDSLIESSTSAEAKASLEAAKLAIENAVTAEVTAIQVKDDEVTDKDSQDTEKSVTIDMYIMSQCPYGVQAEDGAILAVKKFIYSVDYNIYFIVTENADGTFRSLHGQPEVDENMRQACIQEKYPEEFLDYLLCINKNYRTAENEWKTCAEANSIDTVVIDTCFNGDEGKQLLSDSAKKANEIGATGSPTIYFNGESYRGGRDTLSFTKSICQVIPDDPECAAIPECSSDADCTKTGFTGKCLNPNTENATCNFTELKPVNIKILNDKTCEGCDTTAFDQINKQIFINIKTTTIDISTDEGKALLDEIKPVQIPTYIFDETVLESPEYTRLEQYFENKGDYYILSPAIVGQYVSAPKMIGRDKIEGKLDLFAMSKCPFGVMAENNMMEVLENFGDNIDFTIHFIANDNGDGTFRSLHGQPEVDENIRQVCVMEHYSDKFYDYLVCQNINFEAKETLDETWEACAQNNSIDTTAIETCYTGDEGAELLRANIELTNELDIGSSPTFLINNQVKFGGALPAEQIKTKFCAENPDTEGCDNTLSNESKSASGSCG